MTLRFEVNDGGRADAGFKGRTTDCSCRAISIAMQRPYREVYDDLNAWGSQERISKRQRRQAKGSARTGVKMTTLRRYMDSLGWAWVPTMHIGSGTTVHLRDGELPMGRLIVRVVSGHLCAVIDGVIHDTSDPSRGGTRAVYGYWKLSEG